MRPIGPLPCAFGTAHDRAIRCNEMDWTALVCHDTNVAVWWPARGMRPFSEPVQQEPETTRTRLHASRFDDPRQITLPTHGPIGQGRSMAVGRIGPKSISYSLTESSPLGVNEWTTKPECVSDVAGTSNQGVSEHSRL